MVPPRPAAALLMIQSQFRNHPSIRQSPTTNRIDDVPSQLPFRLKHNVVRDAGLFSAACIVGPAFWQIHTASPRPYSPSLPRDAD